MTKLRTAIIVALLLSGCANRGQDGGSSLGWALAGLSAYGSGYTAAYQGYQAPAYAAQPSYCGGQWFGSIWHSYCY